VSVLPLAKLSTILVPRERPHILYSFFATWARYAFIWMIVSPVFTPKRVQASLMEGVSAIEHNSIENFFLQAIRSALSFRTAYHDRALQRGRRVRLASYSTFAGMAPVADCLASEGRLAVFAIDLCPGQRSLSASG
jgi:hypothetical protein